MNILYGNAYVLGLCILCWFAGGWLVAMHGFNLPRREHGLVGAALGIILGNWAANISAQFIPMPFALWAAALFPLVLGLLAAKPWKNLNVIKGTSFSLWQFLILGFLILIWYWIGRGLGIFDDFQNLPLLSFLATGDVPPKFPLDASVNFGYHYFQLLLAAQLMRLGSLFPWTAFDLAQAMTLSFSVMLAALFTQRLTRSQLAATISGIFVLLSGGTRWILLLIPPSLLAKISDDITLLDSTKDTAANLISSLSRSWVIDGAGPLPFPFAYFSGINPPFSMAFDGRGMAGVMILLLMLLTVKKWNSGISVIVTIVLLSSYALADEIGFALFVAGCLSVAVIYFIRQRSFQVPSSTRAWAPPIFAAAILSALQGGVFTGVLSRLFGNTQNTFFSFTFEPMWPPAFVSANYGILSLFNPRQLLVAMAEIGPVILITPLLFVWLIRKIKYQHWGEAFIIASALLSLFTVFIQYTGTGGLRNTSRFIAYLLTLCKIYTVPILWIWLRQRSEAFKAFTYALGFSAIMGGVVFLGFQIIAIPAPNPSKFIAGLDAKAMREYWNQFPRDAVIFDPTPYRGATLFGRSTNSAFNWYETKPEWIQLEKAPDPYELRTAGYTYIYLDQRYFESLPLANQEAFKNPCVKLIGNYEKINQAANFSDYRKLLDISICKR